MTPRSLEVRPTYRKRRLWPWIVGASALVVLGVLEVRVHRRARPTATNERAPVGAEKTRRAAVEGRVLASDGRAASGVPVLAQPENVEGRTGHDGRFRLEVEEGTPLRLEAHHSDLGFAMAEVRAPASDLQLRLAPRAGLEVLVFSGGRRLAGAEVTVRQRGGAGGVFHADRVTDERGMLRFLGLPAGALEVEAVVPATAARGVAVIDGQEGAVARVQVTLP